MFRLCLAVSTALSVLLPGRSVVGDIALAEPGHMNNTYMRAYCIKFDCRKNLARNKYLPNSRPATSDEAWKEPAIFGALWSEDLLTLGKDVPRTPIRHFSQYLFSTSKRCEVWILWFSNLQNTAKEDQNHRIIAQMFYHLHATQGYQPPKTNDEK